MSTKLIGALIILFVVWGGYRIFSNYKDVEEQRWTDQKEASEARDDPSKLQGVPYQLEGSLQQAQGRGADALGQWLELYGNQIRDPRKAWIQLDYCTMIASDDPQQAKAIYKEVKERLHDESPVYPRLKQLQKSFE